MEYTGNSDFLSPKAISQQIETVREGVISPSAKIGLHRKVLYNELSSS